MFKRHVIRQLCSYMDDQLAEKERSKVEAHLKGCELCRNELSRLRLLSEKLKSWQVPEPGPFFADAVKVEIAHQGSERGASKMKIKKWYIAVPSGVLAGCLVLVFLSNVYVRRSMLGRLKESSNQIGKQFDPASGYETGWQAERRDIATGATPLVVLKDKGIVDNNYGDAWGSGVERGKLPYGQFAAKKEPASYEPYYIRNGEYSIAKNSLQHGTVSQSFGQREFVGGAFASMGTQAIGGQIGYDGVAGYKAEYSKSAGEAAAGAVGSSVPEGAPVIIVQPVLPATGIGEKIIRTAEVVLEVEDASQAYSKVSAICQDLGGYLAASNFHKDHEGKQAGTITMRIPKDKFLDALNKINTLGKVENSATQSQDVSQEYTNLNNQLNITMIIYNKMMEALQKRQVTIPEAMYMESELTPILRKVENLKNKIEYLNNAISFTTVTVNFHEPKVSLKALKDSKQGIQEGMLAATIGAIKFLAKAIPVTIAVVIWLAIILVIVNILKNWITRLFKR